MKQKNDTFIKIQQTIIINDLVITLRNSEYKDSEFSTIKKSFFFIKVNKVLLVKSKTKYSNSKEIEKKSLMKTKTN